MTTRQEVIERLIFSKDADTRAYGRLLATGIDGTLGAWMQDEGARRGTPPTAMLYAVMMVAAGAVLTIGRNSFGMDVLPEESFDDVGRALVEALKGLQKTAIQLNSSD